MTVETEKMRVMFRCHPGLENIVPRPIPAVLGVPSWFKSVPLKALNPSSTDTTFTVKKCPPFIDAMTFGFLIPLAVDLEVKDCQFSWDFELPPSFGHYPRAPISFHDPSQVEGTPFFEDDRFIVKFNNFWAIETPPGYSLLFTHPVNRPDLPFTTITGLVDCDAFSDNPVHFPARWHDTNFDGVLPKGTPVAQCLPIKRVVWEPGFEELSTERAKRSVETQDVMERQPGTYRQKFRSPKR
jgi:hypothetical protein